MFDGYLTSFGLTRADAEEMVVHSRLAVGWITEEDLMEPEVVEEEAEVEEVPADIVVREI
jgi:transcription termination/antitermination protein NusA